jgi:ABC-type multidrug transport system fused ATPase/permease subunit
MSVIGARRFAGLPEVFSFIWTHAPRFVKVRLMWALLLLTLASALSAMGPVALKLIVDALNDRTKGPPLWAVLLSGLFVMSQWLGRTTGELRGLTYARAERRMSRMLANRLFGHVIRLPFHYHVERQTTGAVTQILANGRLGYQMVLHTLVFTILPVLIEVAAMVIVLSRLGQRQFLWLFCAAVACYIAAFSYAAGRIMAASRGVSNEQVAANMVIADSFENFESIMYCTGETRVAEEVDAALMRAEEKEVHFYRRFAANGIGVATIYAGFLTATMLYAIHQVQAGRMTVGTFVLVTTYMLQIVRPVEQLGYAVQSLSQGLAYLDKMLDVLREKVAGETAAPQHSPPTSRLIRRAVPVGIHHGGSPHPSDVRGDVLFENVSCSYHSDRTVVKNVNLHLSKAKTVGVVGASGSGKSTLGRLLVRLIEPDQGRILLDGVPISELSLQDLRQAVAVVPQDIALFSKTIFYNIAFGRAGSTREEVEAAAKLAHLHDFIMSLPEGYDTKVGQRGLKLSGGERQRLAIARAAIRRPRVWVLDEATSALDGPAQRQILRNLHEISQSSTALVIAHRLSAIVDADEIVVLEAGVIVERGTHNVLLQQRSRYALLWEAQQHGPAAA